MQACDVFDLVKIEKGFVAEHKAELAANELIDASIMARISDGVELSEIEHDVNDEHAEGLYIHDKLVGCVKRAHDIDQNLSSHVMHENIVSKASSVLSLLHAVKNAGIAKEDVEYVIDCAEEACGDMNQRGGGNFAKSAAEIAGLQAPAAPTQEASAPLRSRYDRGRLACGGGAYRDGGSHRRG